MLIDNDVDNSTKKLGDNARQREASKIQEPLLALSTKKNQLKIRIFSLSSTPCPDSIYVKKLMNKRKLF